MSWFTKALGLDKATNEVKALEKGFQLTADYVKDLVEAVKIGDMVTAVALVPTGEAWVQEAAMLVANPEGALLSGDPFANSRHLFEEFQSTHPGS